MQNFDRKRHIGALRVKFYHVKYHYIIADIAIFNFRQTGSAFFCRNILTGEFIFDLLAIIWIFDRIFDFWWKFRFLNEFSIFDENFDFWPNFLFLMKISIFDENFDFCSNFWFLDENFDFWPNFGSLMKISIFEQKFEKYPWFPKC